MKTKVTNQQTLAEMTPEECYNVMYWLFHTYSWQWNDSKQGIIQWLKTEADRQTLT